MPRSRFTLRAVLLIVAAAACWLGMKVYHAEQWKRALAAIEAIDGYWSYDFQFAPQSHS